MNRSLTFLGIRKRFYQALIEQVPQPMWLSLKHGVCWPAKVVEPATATPPLADYVESDGVRRSISSLRIPPKPRCIFRKVGNPTKPAKNPTTKSDKSWGSANAPEMKMNVKSTENAG